MPILAGNEVGAHHAWSALTPGGVLWLMLTAVRFQPASGNRVASGDGGCRMPGGQQIVSAQHPVVGSWRIAVDVGHVHGPTNLATLSADGTVLVAFPSPTPAAAGSGHRLEYWTPAVGSWEANGDREATMAFVALGVDENGNAVGTHTVTATVTAND